MLVPLHETFQPNIGAVNLGVTRTGLFFCLHISQERRYDTLSRAQSLKAVYVEFTGTISKSLANMPHAIRIIEGGASLIYLTAYS